MIIKVSCFLSKFLIGTAISLIAASANAAFPDRPITMLIGFAPGGGADTVGRILAEKMSTILGQPIVIQNRPGANSILGMRELLRAKPDGYTILLNAASLSIASAVYKNLSFNADKDLAPISLLGTYPYLMTVPVSLPTKTFQEFLEYAKDQKDGVNYASPGVGGAPHLGMELFNSATGLTMSHIPYKGSSAANVDLAAGRVSVMLTNYLAAEALIRDNKFRILAVTSTERSKNFPNAPTMAELGYPEVEVLGWYGLDAPAGTPADVVEAISKAAIQAVSDPGIVKKLDNQGVVTLGSTPDEYRTFFARDAARWKKVAMDSDIRLD